MSEIKPGMVVEISNPCTRDGDATMASRPLPEGQPLTQAEVEELDSFGLINGRMILPERAFELWEREILWGREGGARLNQLPLRRRR